MIFEDRPPAPSRRLTIQFATFGLVVWALSRLVFSSGSMWVLVPVSIARLLFAVLPAWWIARRRGLGGKLSLTPLAIAVPYPFDLINALYSERGNLLPEDLALELSTPTSYLITITALLLASIPLTLWTISRAVPVPISGPMRSQATLVFALTAFAVFLLNPAWSVLAFRYVADPVALVSYCVLIGRAQPVD